MSNHPEVAVIGSGSWATAISKLLLNQCQRIHWYIRNSDHIQHFKSKGSNPKYLTDVEFPLEKILFYNNATRCISNAEYVILAVPSAFLHETLIEIPANLLQEKILFSAIKGIVPQKLQIVGNYLNEEFRVPYAQIGVITGPCHAEEVAMEKLSYLTLAASQEGPAETLAALLRCSYMNVSVSDDIFGTEYSAVLKNIIAIACGMAHGLGYGDNYQAVLVSNAIQEIKRFVEVVHPITRDINASAYLGDLLVTCYSQFSRNRTFGAMLGKGYSVQHAQLEMNMVAEGYYASKCIHHINLTHKVHMPISNCVYEIIYNRLSPRKAFQLLSDQLA